MPPCSRRRHAWPPPPAAAALALSVERRFQRRSLSVRRYRHSRVLSGRVAVARLSRRRCLRRCAGGPSVGLVVPPRSRRRCLRRRASASCAGSVVPPHSRRRDARPPLFRGGGSLSPRGAYPAARALCVWLLAQSLPLWGWSLSRGAHGAAACSGALALLALNRSCRRARGARRLAAAFFAAVARCLDACVVLIGLRSLRAVVGAVASSLGAVAVARRSRRRYLRRRAGTPGAGTVVPPRSRLLGARPPLFHGGGSLSRRALS